jgi:hypothetical protein
MLHALDPDEDLVHVPLVAWPWSAAAQAAGETRTEFLAPASHRLSGDAYAALNQEQPNIPQAEAEHVIQPYSMADNLRGEPMAAVRGRGRLHAASLARLRACGQIRLP